MADLMLDTDIFIDHIRGARVLRLNAEHIYYSIITRCELFAGGRAREDDLRELLAAFSELGIDRTIAEVAGRIRRSVQIATPDALIAATALEHRLTLATRNVRDFGRVPGLQLTSST